MTLPRSRSRLEPAERQNLGALAYACRLNARSLAFEADLLLGHGHPERAYFLALSGHEELAKAELALDFRAGHIDRATFLRAFANHKRKFAYRSRRVSAGDNPGSVSITVDPSEGALGTKHRTQVLYVAHDSSFVPRSPCLPPDADVPALIATLHDNLSDMTLLERLSGADSAVTRGGESPTDARTTAPRLPSKDRSSGRRRQPP